MRVILLCTAFLISNLALADGSLLGAEVLFETEGSSEEYGNCYYTIKHMRDKKWEKEDGSYPVRLFVGADSSMAQKAFNLKTDKNLYEGPSDFVDEEDGYEVQFNKRNKVLTVTQNFGWNEITTKIVIKYNSEDYTDPDSYTLTISQLFGTIVREKVTCKKL